MVFYNNRRYTGPGLRTIREEVEGTESFTGIRTRQRIKKHDTCKGAGLPIHGRGLSYWPKPSTAKKSKTDRARVDQHQAAKNRKKDGD